MNRIAAILLAAAAFPAQAQDKPMRVTSDTPEYCAQLQLRLARIAPVMEDVRRLVAEGREMCDHGEVRGGIVRLRRALVLQKKLGKPPHP